jgi:pimeloyl-ACP methyl ester carboxylesterase
VPRFLKRLLKLALGLLALLLLYFGACLGWLAWRESWSATAAAPAAGGFVQAAGTPVYSQEFNPDGAHGTVLLVHGTGAWSGTWFSLLPALTQAGYRVLAIDLPPFGYSGKDVHADFSREAQAERILAVLAQRKSPPVILVGHSFGGGPALEVALRHPERLQRLVLVDGALGLEAPPPDAGTPGCRVLGNAPARQVLLAGTASNPMFAGALLRKFVARKQAVTEERLAEYLRPQVVEGYSAGLGAWAYQFGCVPERGLSTDARAVARLRVPLSLIWGEQDTVTPPEQARRLQALVPGSTLVLLPGVGHIPHIEDPPAFERALLSAID